MEERGRERDGREGWEGRWVGVEGMGGGKGGVGGGGGKEGRGEERVYHVILRINIFVSSFILVLILILFLLSSSFSKTHTLSSPQVYQCVDTYIELSSLASKAAAATTRAATTTTKSFMFKSSAGKSVKASRRKSIPKFVAPIVAPIVARCQWLTHRGYRGLLLLLLLNQSLADADFEAIGDVCRVLEPAGEKLCVPILRRANVFKKLGGTGVDDVVGYNHASWGEEAFAFSQLEVSDVLCLDVVKEKQDLGSGSVFIGSSLVSASIVVGTGSLGRGNEVLDDAGKLWDHVTARSLEPCDSVLDSCVGKYLVGNGGSFAAGLDGDDGDVGGRCTRHPGGRVAPKHAQLDHNVWSYTSQNVVQNGALDVAHVHHGVGPAKSIDGINHRLGIALFGLRLDVCNQIMSKRHLLLLLCMRIVEIVCLDRE